MPRKKRAAPDNAQADLLDVTSKLRTAPCVPALREAVKAWVAGGYKGITDTTRILLNYWFYTDHKLATGAPFKYHRSQQEAIETLVFVWEFEKVRSRKALLERYAQDLRMCACHPRRLRPVLHQDGDWQWQDESHVSGSRVAILQRSARSG